MTRTFVHRFAANTAQRQARAAETIEDSYHEVSRAGATKYPASRFPCPEDTNLEVRMYRWLKESQLVDFMLEVYDTRTDKKRS